MTARYVFAGGLFGMCVMAAAVCLGEQSEIRRAALPFKGPAGDRSLECELACSLAPAGKGVAAHAQASSACNCISRAASLDMSGTRSHIAHVAPDAAAPLSGNQMTSRESARSFPGKTAGAKLAPHRGSAHGASAVTPLRSKGSPAQGVLVVPHAPPR